MIKQAVIDSNILVALVDKQDKWHVRAQAIFTSLEIEAISIIYFDCVLNETISVLGRRVEEQKRPEQFPMLLDELLRRVSIDKITWVSPEIRRLYLDIIELIRQHSGVLNFHDALIALICRESGINTIISFDQDFSRITWLKTIKQTDDVKTAFPIAEEET